MGAQSQHDDGEHIRHRLERRPLGAEANVILLRPDASKAWIGQMLAAIANLSG